MPPILRVLNTFPLIVVVALMFCLADRQLTLEVTKVSLPQWFAAPTASVVWLAVSVVE